MVMSDDEIRVRFRQAKRPSKQITILAQCNGTTEEHICFIIDGGRAEDFEAESDEHRKIAEKLPQFIDCGTKHVRWNAENVAILRGYLNAGYTFRRISQLTGVGMSVLINAAVRFGITKKELKKENAPTGAATPERAG